MSTPSLRYLAVEDHEFQLHALLAMLEGLGAKHVLGVADGRAALQIANGPDAEVDIIVSDVDMPQMDGMEFLRHLGETGVSASIILASALERPLLSSVETMARAYGLTILGVIKKPVTPAKLRALIDLYQPPTSHATTRSPGAAMVSLDEILIGLKNQEFDAFYQPKINLASSKVAGAEALARWRHPIHGIIPPSAFIGKLEANDQMGELTWIMVTRAATFLKQWHALGNDELTMSVNLSVKLLADIHLAERLAEIVRDSGLEPRHIIFEITESATSTDVGKVLENLSRLRMKGFGLSIDDFGTGFSSMQQLSRIAFTELKIDQSFVATASKQESAMVILEASLDIARRLNISTVAEGIETQDDWNLLRTVGCHFAQGYFIAKPMDGDALLNWVGDTWVST